MDTPERRAELRLRILEAVEFDTNGGCWLWAKALGQKGYGFVAFAGFSRHAHRTSYTLFRGDIPDRLFACHKCDVRSCVNPDHLFLGDARDNRRDMIRKGRNPASNLTHCARGHLWTEATTYRTKSGGRLCRECNRRPFRVRAPASRRAQVEGVS